MRVPEIADDIVSIDNAMKWGFGWEKGPFELWDARGVERIVEDWVREKRPVPPLVEKLRAAGGKSFYVQEGGTTTYFDAASAGYRPLPERPGVILLPSLKARKKEVKKNAGASLIDLGDGVLCLEFHSKMNTIGGDTVQMVHAGVKALGEGFDAMVIGNQAPNFCVGANLMLVLTAIQEGDWDEIHHAVRAFQNANMALKYAPKPVVAAPFGMTLGGGTELCLHATRVRAAAETYMGLVEAGVGLIPAGGGTKEMLLRALDGVPSDPDADPFTYVKESVSEHRHGQGLNQRRRSAPVALSLRAGFHQHESRPADLLTPSNWRLTWFAWDIAPASPARTSARSAKPPLPK